MPRVPLRGAAGRYAPTRFNQNAVQAGGRGRYVQAGPSAFVLRRDLLSLLGIISARLDDVRLIGYDPAEFGASFTILTR